MQLVVLLILAATFTVCASSPDEDHLFQYLLQPQYQKNDLRTTPLSNASQTLTVVVGIDIIKLIALDAVVEVLKLQYWMYYRWKDYRLTWNSSEFGGMASATVHSSKIWKPELVTSNNAKVTDEFEITPQSNYVHVRDDGQCTWYPRYDLSVTHCPVDVTWFPFDQQTCDMSFETWTLQYGRMVLIPRAPEPINVKNLQDSNEWDLDEKTWRRGGANEGYVKIRFYVSLRRKPLYYVVNLIVPCALLSFIAAATFLLQPSCSERLGLTVTILLALSVYQVIVGGHLPSSSNYVPVIVVYFTFIICVCVLAVMVTILVLHMHLRADAYPLVPMPAWLKYILCKRVAVCLCMKLPSLQPQEPPLVIRNTGPSVTIVNNTCSSGPLNQGDCTGRAVHSADENDSVKQLLRKMCHVLQRKLEGEHRKRYERSKEHTIKHDWMLAAAVLDRIFSIAFAVIIVGGSVIAFLNFRNQYFGVR